MENAKESILSTMDDPVGRDSGGEIKKAAIKTAFFEKDIEETNQPPCGGVPTCWAR